MENQIQQIFNFFIIKWVQTGDRVLDNAIIMIINSLMLLIISNFINLITVIYYYFISHYYFKETDDPTDIKFELIINDIKYDVKKIKEYDYYTVLCGSSCLSVSTLLKWVEDKYNYSNVYEQVRILYDNKGENAEQIKDGKNLSVLFMPIWKYKNLNKEYEYIWIYGEKLYSKNLSQLNNCVSKIIQQTNHTNVSTGVLEIFDWLPRSIPSIGKVNKRKTFDTIFFTDKKLLISTLDKFKQKNIYPPSLSLDNKLGILLYGPPGTGKTGTISAIANYMNRHILMIKSLDYLEEKLKFLRENYSKYIIVFDEMDYVLSNKTTTNTLKELIMVTENPEEKNKLIEQMKNSSFKNETSMILSFLDGIEDGDDRIIVGTTNNPDKINKLFLRPGRFDLILELTYCTIQMWNDIIKNVYQEYDFNMSHFKEKTTPLELINILATSENYSGFLDKLKSN